MSKSKQTAKGKQTADLTKNHNLSYLTTLYCVKKVISASIHKILLEEEEEANYHPLTRSAFLHSLVKNQTN